MNSPAAAKIVTAKVTSPILSQRSDDFGKIAAIEIYQLFLLQLCGIALRKTSRFWGFFA
jgi:hypothetical protein